MVIFNAIYSLTFTFNNNFVNSTFFMRCIQPLQMCFLRNKHCIYRKTIYYVIIQFFFEGILNITLVKHSYLPHEFDRTVKNRLRWI